MLGIREIFSYLNDSHMAVAIGERNEGSRRDLWLFHNKERPLWVVDAREALGQVFFVSTPAIWSSALHDCPQAQGLLGGRKHVIVPMPTEEVWYFSVDSERTCVDGPGNGYYRFVFDGKNEYIPWDDDGELFPIAPPLRDLKIISDLGDNDEIIRNVSLPTLSRRQRRNQHRNKNKGAYWDVNNDERVIGGKSVTWSRNGARYSDEEDDAMVEYGAEEHNDVLDPEDEEEGIDGVVSRWSTGLTSVEEHIGKNISRIAVGYDSNTDSDQFNLAALEKVVREIKQAASDIEVSTLNLSKEGSLTPQMFEENLECLQMILKDLKGSQLMLEAY